MKGQQEAAIKKQYMLLNAGEWRQGQSHRAANETKERFQDAPTGSTSGPPNNALRIDWKNTSFWR